MLAPRLWRSAAYLTVGSLAACGLVAGLLRERYVAQRFGATAEVDGFLLALALPTLLAGMVSGPVSYALIPRVAAKAEPRDGHFLIRGALGAALVALTLTTAALLILRAPLVQVLTAYSSEAVRDAVWRAFPWTAATCAVAGATGVLGAALNARERFLLPAIAPLLRHGVFVGAVAVATRGDAAVLAMAALTAVSAEAVLVAVAAHRLSLPVLPSMPIVRGELREILIEAGHLLLNTLLMGSTLLVDQYMASWHGEGAVAAFSFGSRPTAALLTVAGTSLGTVLLPRLAREAAQRGGLPSERFRWLALALGGLGVMGAAILWLTARPLVAVLYGGGAFDTETAETVAAVHGHLGWQIPGYLLSVVYTRVLLATGRGRMLLVAAVTNAGLNVVLNVVLGAWMGVPGIALSTSCVYALTAVTTGVLAHRPISPGPTREVIP